MIAIIVMIVICAVREVSASTDGHDDDDGILRKKMLLPRSLRPTVTAMP